MLELNKSLLKKCTRSLELAKMGNTIVPVLAKLKARLDFYPLSGFLLMALTAYALYLTRENMLSAAVQVKKMNYEEKTTTNGTSQRCDLFSGKWVYDDVSYPLYKEKECSLLRDDWKCEKNGRKDLQYQHWRWQPHHCDLPRFNATAFLEKIRGKRLTFVGDSINRNQWVSMLCLLESKIPPSYKSSINPSQWSIPIPEYNTTIEIHWSPMLVESNGDNPLHHKARNKTVTIKTIEKHARHWTDADILVFDSYAWWLDPPITLVWGSFGSPDAIYRKTTKMLRAYEMVMQTWSDWLEININRTKTMLFFMSSSPIHSFGEEWGRPKGENCYTETEIILEKERNWGSLTYRDMMEIAESTIQKLENKGLKVQYLNITHLSAYRKEAHPSFYRKFTTPLSEQQLANPRRYSDCLHWCLPGVPDVWNQILYAYIMDS